MEPSAGRHYVEVVRPEALCGLLAEPARLRVYAAVVLGATTPGEVTTRTGLPARTVVQALTRLGNGALVSTVEGVLRPDLSAFKDAARQAGERTATPEPHPGATGETTAVLRAFIVDGKLQSIPAPRRKRRAVLEHIVTCFEPGVKYPERAVNAILRAWHPDYASLRRYLVDEGLMGRERAVYHRTGGPVEL